MSGGCPPTHARSGWNGGAAMVGDWGRTGWQDSRSGRYILRPTQSPRREGTPLSTAIWDRIEDARGDWNVLCHPFYERWSAGELTLGELARYSGQYRHAVGAIATMSSAASAAAPDRPELARHAEEERAHLR